MYYILAEQLTGELIQISTSPLIALEKQILKIRSGEIPDLMKYDWNASGLCFVEKVEANRYMSHTSFLKRLTAAEIKTVYQAADTNIDIRIWLDKFKMAQEVWLDHTELVAGITILFGNERAQEILV